jgi:two-component system sensor histidine kinase/response regulator
LLLEGTIADGQYELISAIESASKFMLTLLEDTLNYSAMESGVVQFRAAPQLLAVVVETCVSIGFPLADRKQMTLTVVEHGEPRPVLMDPVKMIKVFNNLIGNAIKYCQRGARIEVLIWYREESVLVTVQDDGPGIDPSDLRTLFTPFQRTRPRAMSEEPSSGLGLAIAKSIVELHGGRIWVRSELGKGSRFYVSLPALVQAALKKS